jgi:hypothetical protein
VDVGHPPDDPIKGIDIPMEGVEPRLFLDVNDDHQAAGQAQREPGDADQGKKPVTEKDSPSRREIMPDHAEDPFIRAGPAADGLFGRLMCSSFSLGLGLSSFPR